jgi:hypothetical protein
MRNQEDKNEAWDNEVRGEEFQASRAGDFAGPKAAGFSGAGVGREIYRLWQKLLRLGQRSPKRLRLCESLPLGERRFVAVVEFDAERFLVGGTSSSMVLLSRLADGPAQQQERDKAAKNAEPAVTENGTGKRW